MAIKELAYSTHQHLQSSTGCSFKRAHIYELLASSFGFKSYAALCSNHIFTQRNKTSAISMQHQQMLQQRISELGYEPVTTIASAFHSFVSEQHIDAIKITDLIGELSPHHRDSTDFNDESSLENGFLEELCSYRDSSEYPQILWEALETKASKGDHRAHYALAQIYKPDDDDYANGDGGYWHSQEQQGRVLKGVKKEWADGFARRVEESKKYTFHLSEAGKLGSAFAAGDLAELAEIQGRDEQARHWLTISAEAGDIYAIRSLIDKYERGDIQRCWMWLYLAEMLGTDLTESHTYAINENGDSVDGDYSGAIFPDVDEGVELMPLDDKRKREARKLADALFQKIQ